MERTKIPTPLIPILSQVMSEAETHASMDNLFMYADAPGDPPEGSKITKATEWLRRINKDISINPLIVLGLLIENYMECDLEDHSSYWGTDNETKEKHREKIQKALDRAGLSYIEGGKITTSTSLPTLELSDHIKNKDFDAIDVEFKRAIKNMGESPREAVSAACNILESVCKTYIEEENLQMPKKQDLNNVWNIVRKDLGLDPQNIQDRDLQEILTGIFATIHGIGALRTHASSAHGSGKKIYNLKSRHVKLAVHSAHTLALFILESWEEKQANKT